MKAPSSKGLAILTFALWLGIAVFEPVCYRSPVVGLDGKPVIDSFGNPVTRPSTSPRNTGESVRYGLFLTSGVLSALGTIWLCARFLSYVRSNYKREAVQPASGDGASHG